MLLAAAMSLTPTITAIGQALACTHAPGVSFTDWVRVRTSFTKENTQ